MAKLKCQHDRRVHVFLSRKQETVVQHRNDGSNCDDRFVAVDKMVYDPKLVDRSALPPNTSINALGKVVMVGTIAEAIERSTKPVRQVKKHKKSTSR